MVLWVQTAVCSGIITRVLNTNQAVELHRAPWLITLNILLVVSFLGYHEFKHRKFLKKDYEFFIKKGTPNFSTEDFERNLKAGKRLMILNEMVIDVTKFIDYHPGGKFVL